VVSAKRIVVDAVELRNTFDFVSAGAPLEHSAYICADTEKIYWTSDTVDLDEDDVPADIHDSDRYIGVPHKNDLGLGRRLTLAFAEKDCPADYETVVRFFQRRGAYSRFEDLLQTRGLLERWYDFENEITDAALRAWCVENGIEVAGG
jgi:hypothetical protein